MSEQSLDETIPHGEEIVERFGGIRPMATKLNVPVTTVQGWKKRDAIPVARRDEILSAAALHDISLKGLLSDSVANDYARPKASSTSSYVSEDPALTEAVQQPRKTQPAAAPKAAYSGVDLNQVKNAARRTSFVTSTAIGVIILGAGFLLFGQNASVPGTNANLERRIDAVETRVGDVQNVTQTISDLQRQVGELSNTVSMSISQRLSALEQQLQSAGAGAPLAGAVDSVQSMMQTPQGQAQLQSAVAELRQIVTGLQGQTANLDQALVQARGQTDALGQTLAQVSGRDVGAAAMLLTLNQLRQSTGRETPFAEDLALLRDVAQNNDPELAAAIDRLAPFAATGVLSPEGLKRELLAAAGDIVSTKINNPQASWKERLMARLQGLFTIRKDGVPVTTASSEHSVIDRASAQLDAGNVEGALQTVQQMDGAASQNWQTKASATILAQQLDTQIVRALVTRVRNGLTGVPQPINLAPQTQVQVQPQSQAPEYTAPEITTPESAPQDMPAPDNNAIISQ